MTKYSAPLRGDIYWADLNPVVGSEQSGLRPVFVISNNLLNKSIDTCIIIPMTRGNEKLADKKHPSTIEYHTDHIDLEDGAINEIVKLGGGFATGVKGFLLVHHSRSLDKSRLKVKIGRFKSDDYISEANDSVIHCYGLLTCKKCESPIRKGGLKCGNPSCNEPHSKKCRCGRINPLRFKFCPSCGREGK